MTDVSARADTAPARTGAALTLLIACGATFMAFLDLSVVNIAFPAILREFTGTPPATLTWVVSGYAVAFAALMTPAGRLADVVGRKRVFLAALFGFALTSLLCALAGGPDWLIAGRVLQGATAALMIPAALGLVLGATPPERIGAAIGAWSASGGFASVVGPALGGALVDVFGWRSVFVINVPVAALLVAVGWRIADPHTATAGRSSWPDPLGLVASAFGIGAVVAGVTEGQQWGWTALRTLAALVVGVLLIGLALLRSRRHPSPAIAVGLWRSHRYALTNATSFVFGLAMFAWLLAGPLFLDMIWHYSVFASAGALSIGAVASMITATVAGRITAPAGQRLLGILGALMFAASTLWMSTDTFGPKAVLWSAWMPAGILGGGGVGLVVTVLGTAAASSLPPQQFATGVGMNTTARQVGGALGIAMLAAVFAAHSHSPLTAFHLLFALCGVVGLASAALAAIIPAPKELAR